METLDNGFVDSGSSPPASPRIGLTPHDPAATPTHPGKLSLNKVGIRRLRPNKGCPRKFRFSTRLEALLYAAILNGRPQPDPERIAEPYFCTFCNRWHITSGGVVRIIDRMWSQVAA
jgi:hypothetical protein